MTDYERYFHPAQPPQPTPTATEEPAGDDAVADDVSAAGAQQAINPAAVKGCLLLCHGMAEHQARYFPLVRYLNQHGWHVATYDHPGHGESARVTATQGQLGAQGWQAMTDRLQDMLAFVAAQAGDVPLWLVGHSMGSFTVLDYATRFPLPDNLRGLVLIGSDSPQASAVTPLKWLSRWLIRRRGADAVSPLLQKLTFGAFNKRVPDAETEYDWICSARPVVDAYQADPLCGFACSVGLWHELSKTLLRLHNNAGLRRLPEHCQVIVMAGGQDPVGRFGAGPKQLVQRLRQYGPGAELKLYPTLRHEILNETDNRPVWADLQRMVADFTQR